MRPFELLHRRRSHLGALLLLSALSLPALTSGGSAGASGGAAWSEVTLPHGFTLPTFNAQVQTAPVSCTPGTTHCVVVTGHTGTSGVSPTYGTVVTTNLVRWTGYTSLSAGVESVSSISCPTLTHCVATGISFPGPTPFIGLSSDGGRSFTAVSPPGSSAWQPNSVSCPTATTCYVVGALRSTDRPFIAASHDGGASWTTLDTAALRKGSVLYAVSCATATHCVAVGIGSGAPAAIFTTNGWATWAHAVLPLQVATLGSISCVARQAFCEAGGSFPSGELVLAASTNGGRSFVASPLQFGTGGISSLSCATAARCWAATSGVNVPLLGTADGGDIWEPVGYGSTQAWGEISCASATVCVAATGGLLVETRGNGGLNAHTGQAPPPPVAPSGAIKPVLGTPTTPGVSVDVNEARAVGFALWREMRSARHYEDPRALAIVESGPALAVDASQCEGACTPPPLPPPPRETGVTVVVPRETTWPAVFLGDGNSTTGCTVSGFSCNDVFVAVQTRAGAPWKINLVSSYVGPPVAPVPTSASVPALPNAFSLVSDYARVLLAVKHTGKVPANTVFAKSPFTTGIAQSHHFTEAAAALDGYSYALRYTPQHAPLYQFETSLGPLSCGVVAWTEIDTALAGMRLVQLGDLSTWGPPLSPGTYRTIIYKGAHMNCFVPSNFSATAPDHRVYVLSDWSGPTSEVGVR